MSYWKVFLTLLEKDVRLEGRTREGVTATLVFSLLTLIIFSMVVEQSVRPSILSGIFWISVSFSSILGFDRSVHRDTENRTLEAFLLVPLDRSVLFLAKWAFNFLLVTFIEITTLFFLLALFNFFPPFQNILGFLFLSLLIGLGFSASGTLYATISQKARARELLLPLLFLPVVLPLLMAGIRTGSSLFSGEGGIDTPWLALVILFDFLYLALGVWLYELIITE